MLFALVFLCFLSGANWRTCCDQNINHEISSLSIWDIKTTSSTSGIKYGVFSLGGTKWSWGNEQVMKRIYEVCTAHSSLAYSLNISSILSRWLGRKGTWIGSHRSSYASVSTGLGGQASLTVMPMHTCEKTSSVTICPCHVYFYPTHGFNPRLGSLSLLAERRPPNNRFSLVLPHFLTSVEQWTIVPCKCWLCLLLRTLIRGLGPVVWGRRCMFSGLKRTICTTSFNVSSLPSTCGTGRAPLWWWEEMDATSIRLPFRS